LSSPTLVAFFRTALGTLAELANDLADLATYYEGSLSVISIRSFMETFLV